MIPLSKRTTQIERVLRSKSGNDADFITFGGGLPDPVTHPVGALAKLASEILLSNDKEATAYSYESGDVMLRSAIAARMSAKEGLNLNVDQVVLTNGSSGSLNLAALALIDPGDVIITERMTYRAGLLTFRQAGAKILAVPMDEQGLCVDVLPELLDRAAAEGKTVKMIYTIANCQSPTGTVMAIERRQRLAKLAHERNLVILQDDTYGEIRYADVFPPHLIALAPERTIHVGSFSKTIFPGLRVGWAVSSPEIVEAMAGLRTDLGNSAVNQRIIARFLADGSFDAHLADATRHYLRKRSVLIGALNRHCSTLGSWDVPNGGFFLYLRLNSGDSEHIGVEAAAQGVAVLPSTYFCAGDRDAGGIRLAFGETPIERIDEGIRRLSDVIRRAPRN